MTWIKLEAKKVFRDLFLYFVSLDLFPQTERQHSLRSCTSRKGVDVYFKIDRFTQQRVMLAVTTVTCDIKDAVEYILDPNMRFKYDALVKVNQAIIPAYPASQRNT